MKTNAEQAGKILILATESCAYPGANSVGQAHASYPTNTYILRVRAPVLFLEKFYMDCFRKGISGPARWMRPSASVAGSANTVAR